MLAGKGLNREALWFNMWKKGLSEESVVKSVYVATEFCVKLERGEIEGKVCDFSPKFVTEEPKCMQKARFSSHVMCP